MYFWTPAAIPLQEVCMSDPRSEKLDHLREEYRRKLGQVQETQRLLKEISCTVTSPRKEVSVTVAHGGVVKEVKFPTAAFKRMAPTELATLLTKTIADAQQAATRETAAVFAPTLPPGIDATRLFSGEVDLHEMLPEEPVFPEHLRDAIKFGR
jgi:hypothetical protein